MSVQELSKILNISTQAVSKWEKDISKPNADNLIKLMKILDISYDNLHTKPVFKDIPHILIMKSVKELYKIGRGPSSSHTIGPERACIRFKQENKDADEFRIVLYGDENTSKSKSVYDMFSFAEIAEYCKNNSLKL